MNEWVDKIGKDGSMEDWMIRSKAWMDERISVVKCTVKKCNK